MLLNCKFFIKILILEKSFVFKNIIEWSEKVDKINTFNLPQHNSNPTVTFINNRCAIVNNWVWISFGFLLFVVFRCQGQYVCITINGNVGKLIFNLMSRWTHIHLFDVFYTYFFSVLKISHCERFIAQFFALFLFFWHSLHDDLHFLHTRMNSSSDLAFVFAFCERNQFDVVHYLFIKKVIVFILEKNV